MTSARWMTRWRPRPKRPAPTITRTAEEPMNTRLKAAVDATPAPTGFSIPTLADLRDTDAVLVVEAHWWLRSRRTARWLRLPVADLDGLDAAGRARVVENALDRLEDLPALHAYIPPIRHL